MRLTWTKRLLLLTPLLALLVIVTAGGGHGTPIPMALCYPIFFLFRFFDSGGGALVWILLLGQFPLYGLLIDSTKQGWQQIIVTAVIAVFHVSLVVVVFHDRQF